MKDLFRKNSLWIGITIGYFLVYWFIYGVLAFTEVCNDWLCKCWWIMGRVSFYCALLLLFRLNIARLLAILLLFIKLTAGSVINLYDLVYMVVYPDKFYFSINIYCAIFLLILVYIMSFILRFIILKFLLKPETKEWFCLEEKVVKWIKK